MAIHESSKKFKVKFHFLGLMACLLVSSCAPTDQTDRISVIKDYEAAHNAHDFDKVMSLVSDDIIFVAGDIVTGSGKARLLQLEIWDSAIHGSQSFEILDVRGDSVFCNVTERSEFYRGFGLLKIEHKNSVFLVNKEAVIYRIISNPDKNLQTKLMRGMGVLKAWCENNNDNTMTELLQTGEFEFTVESAEKWLDLFERWHQAVGVEIPDE